jgi:hypothetical protein
MPMNHFKQIGLIYRMSSTHFSKVNMSRLTLEESIAAIEKQMAQHRFPMQPGCPETEVTHLKAAAHKRLGVCLPERYLDLLRITDGIDENGLHVFGSHRARNVVSDVIGREVFILGFTEENENLRADREGYNELIVFASEAMVVHALDLRSGKYMELPHADDWPSRLFDTFEEMIVCAIRRILRP